MKDEPEIVKILRREELLRELKNETQETSQDQELSTDKPIIILDETTSVFDNESEAEKDEENEIETKMFLLDDIDEAIIQLVKVNRWITPSEIARVIGCSHTAIKYRIYALYKEGFLTNYSRIRGTKQRRIS